MKVNVTSLDFWSKRVQSNRKYLVSAFAVLCSSVHATEIPKSSLQAVRNNIEHQLKEAELKKDDTAVAKFKKDLGDLDKKIKKFELEWLNYRKHQLEVRPSTPQTDAEIKEIEILVKARK